MGNSNKGDSDILFHSITSGSAGRRRKACSLRDSKQHRDCGAPAQRCCWVAAPGTGSRARIGRDGHGRGTRSVAVVAGQPRAQGVRTGGRSARHGARQRVGRHHRQGLRSRHRDSLHAKASRCARATCWSSSTAKRRAPISRKQRPPRATAAVSSSAAGAVRRPGAVRGAARSAAGDCARERSARRSGALATSTIASSRAPFAGRVGLRNVSVGSLVSPGTVITTLDDPSVVKLDFSVPEVFLATLKRGPDRPGAAAPRIRARRSAARSSSIDSRVDP